MNTESEDRLLKRVEQLHDKLDEHSNETRDRWESHEKEHRAHDKEHSDIGQWQVKTEERLRAGAGTISDLQARTKPFSGPVIASTIIAIIGFPVVAALWVRNGLDEKADKLVVAQIGSKAESDVQKMTDKIETLTVTVAHLIDKIQTKGR